LPYWKTGGMEKSGADVIAPGVGRYRSHLLGSDSSYYEFRRREYQSKISEVGPARWFERTVLGYKGSVAIDIWKASSEAEIAARIGEKTCMHCGAVL